SGDGIEAVRLELGRRNRTHVEVLSGLDDGDRVTRSDLSAELAVRMAERSTDPSDSDGTHKVGSR
ncbi:MAG: hypothetical protein AAGC55_27840, partial [Myxococcota bacterium]